jgi:5,6-dimethylbenzimidazole synthase
VDRPTLEQILAAGLRAPSPLNSQPWTFMVITGQTRKQAIHEEAERCRAWAMEQSGWRWLGKYKTDFLLQAPVLVAVVGDPKKSGMDIFQDGGPVGYLLAAHALDLGSLYFTLFDEDHLRSILDVPEDKTPVAIVCIGKPGAPQKPVPRKPIDEKTVYLEN